MTSRNLWFAIWFGHPLLRDSEDDTKIPHSLPHYRQKTKTVVTCNTAYLFPKTTKKNSNRKLIYIHNTPINISEPLAVGGPQVEKHCPSALINLRYADTLSSEFELYDSDSWGKTVLLEPVTSNYYMNASERKKTKYFYCGRVTLREHHVHMKCQIKDVHQLCYIGFIAVTRNIDLDFQNSFIFVYLQFWHASF
jgi:hypothetical protein